MLGFITSDCLAILNWRNEADLGSLNAAARAFVSRGFARRITPNDRPIDYMASGSFQGKLLSVYKIEAVSLTHQMNTDKHR